MHTHRNMLFNDDFMKGYEKCILTYTDWTSDIHRRIVSIRCIAPFLIFTVSCFCKFTNMMINCKGCFGRSKNLLQPYQRQRQLP